MSPHLWGTGSPADIYANHTVVFEVLCGALPFLVMKNLELEQSGVVWISHIFQIRDVDPPSKVSEAVWIGSLSNAFSGCFSDTAFLLGDSSHIR